MICIIKRTKVFINPGAVGTLNAHVNAAASPEPQTLPDWVTKTDTYNIGVKDGSIVEMKGGK